VGDGPSLPDWGSMAVVGRIARAHGNRGQVIVDADTDFPRERFRPDGELFVQRGGLVTRLVIADVRFQHERPVLTLAGVATMDDAEGLAGLELRVPVDRLATLPAGMFYRHALVGCRVETAAGEDVGVVRRVDGSLGGSHLVVDGPRGEVLVPLAVDICRVIDPGGKRIVIDPPAGLLELNSRRMPAPTRER